MKTCLRYGLIAAALSVAAFAADPATTTATPAAPASADRPAPPAAKLRSHARLAVIADQLGLTDAQKAQLKDLRKQTGATIKGIRDNTSLTADQQKEQIKAQRLAAREQFNAVLTADQRARFAELTAHPAKVHALVEHRLRAGKFAAELGLSDAQKSQLKQIRQSARASIQPIRANAALTPDQKRTQIQSVLQAARTQVRGVLTPDQQQKLDDLRERAVDRMLRLG